MQRLTPLILTAFFLTVIFGRSHRKLEGMAKKPYREDIRGGEMFSGWSPWYTAIVPEGSPEWKLYEKRGDGDIGLLYIPIKDRFAEYDDGIYELRASRGDKNYVVYIGSASRQEPGAISERIMEHCRGSSHKGDLINRALRYGYKIYFRAKPVRGNRKIVWESENKFLRKFNYAWNKRMNGRIRRSVPPR